EVLLLRGPAGVVEQLRAGPGLRRRRRFGGQHEWRDAGERGDGRHQDQRARRRDAHFRNGVTMLRVASWLTGSAETDVRTARQSESAGTRGVTRFGDGMTSDATTTAATATAAVAAAVRRGTRDRRRARTSAMSGERTSSQKPARASCTGRPRSAPRATA